jgi:hypothetical protein
MDGFQTSVVFHIILSLSSIVLAGFRFPVKFDLDAKSQYNNFPENYTCGICRFIIIVVVE